MIFATWILFFVIQIISGKLYEVEDKNEMKKLLNSHSNILVSFLENDKVEILSLLQDLAVKGNKLAKVLTINCKVNKKLCKQYKAVDFKNYVIHHFHKGKFNKVYDRKMKIDSLLRFLEDPTGDIAWEEDDTARDVFHAKSSQDLQKLVSKFKNNIPQMMLMFYAPWCNFCKQMKPEFAAAATVLKGKTIFIGINGDLPGTDDLKQAFNITGYPSVFLIKDGSKVYKYENENSRDALVKFVYEPTKTSPSAPKEVPWSEETTDIDFLTDSNFHDYVSEHDSVLVMFYAPWCGHCKSMKPEVVEAVLEMKKLNIDGKIAAIDATEHRNVSDEFKIKGFPTIKYFKSGEYQFDVNERSASGLLKFMKDPQKPVEPEPELPWKEEKSSVIHPSSSEFKSILKRFKHSLVMFYAPWCGHCKTTKPMFTSAANQMESNEKVAFVAVDCTEASFSALCTAEGVTGFPTFRYFNYGKNTSHSEYSLERTEDDFVAFMTNPVNPKLDPRRNWRHIPGNEAVVILSADTFQPNLTNRDSGSLVMFYSPWCRHCVSMKPAYVKAAQILQQSLPSCLLAAVDITSEPALGTQHQVKAFPTLLYFPPQGKWIKYEGKRSEDDIVQFMIQKDTELKKEKEEEEKREQKRKEELERKESEEKERKLEEERVKEENRRKAEQKKKEELEKKQKEEENKRKQEEIEKKKKEEEEIERKKIEEENKRKKEEIEKKKREEEERKRKEKEQQEQKKKEELEKKQKEDKEKEKKKEEIEKKKREEEERKRKEKEQQEQKKKEELQKKQKEDKENKKKKEEIEKKKREEEERRNKEEQKKREEFERKKNEKEREENEKKRLEEEEIQRKKDQEHKKKYQHKEDDEEGWGVQFLTVTDMKSFNEYSQSTMGSVSVFYFHNNNRKSSVRNKLIKILNKTAGQKKQSKPTIVTHQYEVDCQQASGLCDELNVIDLPEIWIYANGQKLGSLMGNNWNEDSFRQLLEHSIREEL